MTAIFEGGYAGHIQRFVVRHVSEDYPHGSNLLRLQLVREFLSETGMPHRARIFQNWTYDGRVEANQVFRVRACSLHNFEEVQSGSRFCTNKFDVGIPFQIGGDVDAQELERRNSVDSNSIDDKMRWRSLLYRTKDDFFRLLAVQFHVVGHCPVEKFTNDFIEPASFLPFQEFRQSCVVDELVSETVQPQGVNEDDEDYRSQPCTLRHSSIQCQPPRKELPDPDTLLSVFQERIYPADNVARDAKLHEPFDDQSVVDVVERFCKVDEDRSYRITVIERLKPLMSHVQ